MAFLAGGVFRPMPPCTPELLRPILFVLNAATLKGGMEHFFSLRWRPHEVFGRELGSAQRMMKRAVRILPPVRAHTAGFGIRENHPIRRCCPVVIRSLKEFIEVRWRQAHLRPERLPRVLMPSDAEWLMRRIMQKGGELAFPKVGLWGGWHGEENGGEVCSMRGRGCPGISVNLRAQRGL